MESGKYPFWSYEYIFTNGQPSAQVADFSAFIQRDRALLKQLHFIPTNAMNV